MRKLIQAVEHFNNNNKNTRNNKKLEKLEIKFYMQSFLTFKLYKIVKYEIITYF